MFSSVKLNQQQNTVAWESDTSGRVERPARPEAASVARSRAYRAYLGSSRARRAIFRDESIVRPEDPEFLRGGIGGLTKSG